MTNRSITDKSKSGNETTGFLNETAANANHNAYLENDTHSLQKEPSQIYYPHELGITCIENNQPISTVLRR